MTWETIDHTASSITDRMQVPGGWLYRTRCWTRDEPRRLTVAMTFVPQT